MRKQLWGALGGAVVGIAVGCWLVWLLFIQPAVDTTGPEPVPPTPAAVAVPVEDPALTLFRYAVAELEPDGGWTFGAMELTTMHAGCWPEQYADMPRDALPVVVVRQLADPWCILDPDVPPARPQHPRRAGGGAPVNSERIHEVCSHVDAARHRVVGSDTRTICGRVAKWFGTLPTEGCPVCFEPTPDIGDHPLAPVWELCDRLDAAANAATRPRPVEPTEPPTPTRRPQWMSSMRS